LRGRSQRLELCRDGRFHHLTPLRGRRTGRSEPAHLRTDGVSLG
jgi:hypothetical protein